MGLDSLVNKIMTDSPQAKPYGIVVNMPADDPMSAPHLLGENWSGERWYESASERDRAYEGMMRNPGNYRKGDRPSTILRKVDPD